MTEIDARRTKKLRLISRILIIATGVVWGVYDLLPSMNAGRGDTISENMRDWGRSAWVLPFFWGALTSHLFVNIGQSQNYKVRFYTLAATFAFLIVVDGVVWGFTRWEAPMGFRAAALALGVVAGLIFWAQNP